MTLYNYYKYDNAYLHVIIRREWLFAVVALETFDSSMHFQMLYQVSALSESHFALIAFEWTFTGVDSHMVKEIVPFAKIFCRMVLWLFAIEMVTFKDFHNSFCLRILIFKGFDWSHNLWCFLLNWYAVRIYFDFVSNFNS